jgi:predicted methyltransferase
MKFLTRKGDVEYFSNDKFIYAKENKDVLKLALFDNGFYKLRLVNGIPILEIDGLRMNLVKGFKTPLEYPGEVAKLLFQQTKSGNPKQKTGSCLDTCTGLGYTAIEAAKNARSVVTCEVSDAVLTLAQWNPWSQDLFENKRIELINASISNEIKKMKSNRFDTIIHDPPRFSKAGELYSFEFYVELLRVMRSGSRLFHYVGSVGKHKGRKIHQEVSARLKKAGFRNIRYKPKLQGLYAEK